MKTKWQFRLTVGLNLLIVLFVLAAPTLSGVGDPSQFGRIQSDAEKAVSYSTGLLSEDFEDGILDGRITVETTGSFNSAPGIKEITNFGSSKAFGFGLSTCDSSCLYSYMTKLVITFAAPTYVSTLSFKEMELYGNWGSGGKIYIDDEAINEGNDVFGREPYNDAQADTTYRSKNFPINDVISVIELQVWDITSSSEIFIDDLQISGETSVCAMPPSGIVSWWSGDGHPFDLIDENHGTMLNGATYADGMVGRSFSLDGVDDTVHVPDSESLQAITNNFSIEAWVKPSSLPSGDPYYDSGIVVREGYVKGFALVTKGDTFGLWIGTDSVPGVIATSGPITTTNWYHVVGTYDGSNARIYVDGELENTQPATIVINNVDLYIGSTAGGQRFFNGLIDEVAIYNRTLTDAEISAIYHAGYAGKCKPCFSPPANMVSWWPLNEGTGTIAKDIHGANNGVINGATWSAGKVAWALRFDGLDDYVDIPNSASTLLNNSAGTITAWVKPSVIGGNDIIAAFGSGNNGEGIGLGILEKVRIYHHTGAYDWQSTTSVSANTWTFLAYTWDGTTEYIYNNGEFSESRLRNFNYVPGKARIGHGFWGDPDNAFPGLIDEVEVYNRTLTAEEIAAIYAADSAGKCGVFSTLCLPSIMR
jgi:hypothetical protein